MVCIMGFVTITLAQTHQVSGVVISADDGQPVVGATVMVEGTNIGIATDIDGKFSLNVPITAKNLKVSYIGMDSKTVPFRLGQTLKIILQSNTRLLDEIVVTGYGNFKKSTFTGSAANMSTGKLENVPTLSVEDKIAGNIPGVTVGNTSGAPGAVNFIRIRGMGSINAGNDPLYVIDGTPVQSGNFSPFNGPNSGGYNEAGTNILSTLNSNDIESITVIKDAAAASLYGSRAANGVIVITTKGGQSGKTQVNLRSDWGFSNMAINWRPTLSGDDRRTLLTLGLKNYAMYNLKEDEATATQYAASNIDTYAAKPSAGWTNWRDLIFKTGSHQNYEVNVSGGTDKTKFYGSLSYAKQEGIVPLSGLERMTGNVNVSHSTDRFKIDVTSLVSSISQDMNNEGTSYTSPMMCAMWTCSPSIVPYNSDGSYATKFPLTNGKNPLLAWAYNYDRNKLFRSYSTLAVSYHIYDNLWIREKVAYDYTTATEDDLWDKRTGDGVSYNGLLQRQIITQKTLNTQTQLTYNKTIAEKHNVDALVGFETEDYNSAYNYLQGNDYPGYLYEIGNAGTKDASSGQSDYRLSSFLGRVNYNYSNKYYLGLSYRTDGSSRLARANRWGSFWSVSGSWRFMSESFMQSLSSVLTDGKIRASYGLNGTQPSDYYGYMNLYKYGENYNGTSGMGIIGVGNPSLKWEKNKALNLGIDLTFWNKLSVTLDYYNRKSSDLLMDKAISMIPGYYDTNYNAVALQNVGALRNTGIELTIQSNNIHKTDFDWTTTFNISHNKNKLLKLDGVENQTVDASSAYLIHKVGEPYYSYYLYESAGVDSQTGNELFYLNDGTSNARQTTTDLSKCKKIVAGHHDPKIEGGLTNFLRWKFIDLNMTFTYSFGGKAFDGATWQHDNGGQYTYKGAIPTYYKIDEMWQKPGDNAKLPKFQYGNTRLQSSRWLMPTRYVRLKNLVMGLTIPKNILAKAGISKARVYFGANNLLTFKSKDLFVDPEMSPSGLCIAAMPALRTYTFGIEIGF